MNHSAPFAWLRPDGQEVPFSDRQSLLKDILSGRIDEEDRIRVSREGSWVRAGTVLDALTDAVRERAHPPLVTAQAPTTYAEALSTWRRGPLSESHWVPESAPWRRYFARVMDFIVAGAVTAFLFGALLPSFWTGSDYDTLFWVAGTLITFPLLDAFTLSRWGTSPGKWLLSVRTVQPDGRSVPFDVAFERAYGVVIKGLWFGVPVLTIIPLLIAHSRAAKGQLQPWEQSARTVSLAAPLDGRIVVYVGILVLIGFLSLLGSG